MHNYSYLIGITRLLIFSVLCIICSLNNACYGQGNDTTSITQTSYQIKVYPNAIWTEYPSEKKRDKSGFSYHVYENIIEKKETIFGIWRKVHPTTDTLNLIPGVESPQGNYISFNANRGNVFEYIDEHETSIEFMFDYKIKKKNCRGVFTTSNAIMFESDYKNSKFDFAIQVFPKEGYLLLITAQNEIVTYQKVTDL